MKKLLLLLVLAAACAATVALTQAGAGPNARPFDEVSANQAGPYAFAVGAGLRPADIFAERHVAFSAHNGPRGASGEFSSQGGEHPALTFTGEVTCLFVDGNRAVIGGIIRHDALTSDLEGTMFFAAVEDNGEPPDAVPDRVSAYYLGVPPGELTCEAATSLYPTFAPIASGNITVK
jgi:hypothetical protein